MRILHQGGLGFKGVGKEYRNIVRKDYIPFFPTKNKGLTGWRIIHGFGVGRLEEGGFRGDMRLHDLKA